MDQPDFQQNEVSFAEFASFAFHKLASLEARFVILCHRAQAAGIECSDLHDYVISSADDAAPPLTKLVN